MSAEPERSEPFTSQNKNPVIPSLSRDQPPEDDRTSHGYLVDLNQT
jgi:hypothetical protein